MSLARRRLPLVRPLLLGAALLCAWACVPGGAWAANVTATGTVSGTTLSLATSATPTFSASLDAGDQTPTYTIPLTIQDTRGTGAGWNVTITSTTFSTGGGTPNLLAANASALTGVTSACTAGTCTSPTNTQTYPTTVPAATTAPAAVKFFDSAASTGMGKFTVTPTIGVSVPENSIAGAYSSTVTLAVVTGP